MLEKDRLQQLEQRLAFIEQRLRGLEIDIEPEGRISEEFEYIFNDIDSFRDETRKCLTRLEHGQNQIKVNLDVILRYLTGMGQT